MKKFHYWLFITLFLLLLSANIHEASAMNTGFSTGTMQESDIRRFVSNVSISPLAEPPEQRAIQCFDISKNGMIVIGQKAANGKKELCVYSPDGVFQYGYVFNCGQDFGVEWDGDQINIYFVRSDVILALDKDSEIIDVAKVENTVENNSYRNDVIFSTERTVGSTRYAVKNDMGIFNMVATSYSKLVAIDSSGEEIILYDVSSAQLAKTISICVLIVFFFAAMLIINGHYIKLKRKI